MRERTLCMSVFPKPGITRDQASLDPAVLQDRATLDRPRASPARCARNRPAASTAVRHPHSKIAAFGGSADTVGPGMIPNPRNRFFTTSADGSVKYAYFSACTSFGTSFTAA